MSIIHPRGAAGAPRGEAGAPPGEADAPPGGPTAARARRPARVLRAGGLAIMAGIVAFAAVSWRHSPPAAGDTIALSGNGTAGTPSPSQPGVALPTAPGSFRISGNVAGLYPGARLPLVLTVTNPQHFAIAVTTLSVSAGNAAPGCTAANLTATSFSGRLTVPAGGTGAVSVRVTLAHSAPNACQGAVFPLRYTGVASKAG
jgi:hypothetical protein